MKDQNKLYKENEKKQEKQEKQEKLQNLNLNDYIDAHIGLEGKNPRTKDLPDKPSAK